jgi:hypothetical protein
LADLAVEPGLTLNFLTLIKFWSMKKLLLFFLVLILAALVAYRLTSKKQAPPEEKKDAPLSIYKNSGPFNISFDKILNDYFSLKDALVNWDSTGADLAAQHLQRSTDSLDLKELKGDSTIIGTAQNLASSMSSEVVGLIGESGLEQKRRSFNVLTDELYNLIRTVRFDGAVIYHIRCPMAFHDSSEGYWLSNSSIVVNPYLGRKHPTYKDKMVGCGEIVDSLSFSK